MKTSVLGSTFLDRYKIHKLRNFLETNWPYLFGRLSHDLRGNHTMRSSRGQHFFAGLAFPDAGGASSTWSRLSLQSNDNIDATILVQMRNNPAQSFEVEKEPWGFSKTNQKYPEILQAITECFNGAFEWDADLFNWRIVGHTKRTWPLTEFLNADLIDGFPGSSWYLFKYKIWENKEGIERMVLKIGPSKDELGFYSVDIEGVGLDEDDFIPLLYDGLVFVDTKGRTVLLMKDLNDAFANIVLFTENDKNFTNAEITIGHFSYLSTSMDVHKNLTKSVVVTKQNPLDELTPKALISASDIDRENVTLRAIAFYLSEKKSSRLSSIQEPIYTAKYFRKWVERRNGISFKDEMDL